MGWLSLIIVVGLVAPGLGELARRLFSRWFAEMDPAAERGIATLLGLGLTGTLAYFLGFVSTMASVGLIGLASLVGLALLAKGGLTEHFKWNKSAIGLVLLASIMPIVNVVTPSTTFDWDSIAYHLAVPKIWLRDGHVSSVSFIHHSNFPFAVDALNLFGLSVGGQSGGKAFQLAFFLFGMLAIYGLVREKYGAKAAAWATAAFATIPIVQWEAGSAYIDIAHGLYAGLGALLAIQGMRDPRRLMLGGLMMGLALGTKYTGLQSLFALGAVLIMLLVTMKPATGVKGIAAGLGLALLVGGPWYLKNAALVGNPVYPFFYEQLGGKNWNQKQADIYRIEQKTFGVPSEPPLSIGHSILGLAYAPGRYVNPQPKLLVEEGKPTGGAGGFPIGAVGGAVILAGILAALRRRSEEPESGALLGWLLISVLLWAFLSQQSRYVTSFAPVLCFLLGGLVARPHWFGKALMGAVVLQGLVTAYVGKSFLIPTDRLQAAVGVLPADDFLKGNLGFYDGATKLNQDSLVKKVALFDEVFGFYLDKPYFWGNYGHTTELGYEAMKSVDDFSAALKKQGVSHLYVNIAAADAEFKQGLTEILQAKPVTIHANKYLADDQAKWKGFILQGLVSGKIQPVAGTRGGLILMLTE